MDHKEPSSPPRQKIKKEKEEIKEFAETAMNELLGWYGYERLELRRWAASRARDASSPDQSTTEHKDKDECSWCNKSIGTDGSALQQNGSTFCSELCFSQSRRANFKRAKTCDWCRHVRHTVAYVDFQDGATQLQFCSDKCLNQYKMHIFCRETQAHLDRNPHLVSAASTSNLITPDLWLRNCKSRSTSPTSEKSISPTLDNLVKQKQTNKSDKIDVTKHHGKSPTPLITIASPSKLMKKGFGEEKVRKSPEVKKDIKNNKVNLRKRRASKCTATVTSQTLPRLTSSTPKAQDLRICSPIETVSPASTIGNSANISPANNMTPHLSNIHSQFPNPMFGMPPPMYMDNLPPLSEPRIPNMFPNDFIPRTPMGFTAERPRLPPPLNIPQTGLAQPPPVTVLVPYPVLLPIPIPIPIPLPMSAIIQAHCTRLKTEVKPPEDSEGPLDFTMNNDRRMEDSHSPLPPSKLDSVNNSEDNENERNEAEVDRETEPQELSNPEQTLPKFKITRVTNKIAKVVNKPREMSESTRPLRKRRRLVEVSTDEDLISKTRKIVQV